MVAWKSIAGAVVGVLFLAGCASNTGTQVAETETTTREYRTGSNIPKKDTDAKVVSKEAIERTMDNRPRVIGPGGAP